MRHTLLSNDDDDDDDGDDGIFEPNLFIISDRDPNQLNIKLSTLLQDGESVVVDDSPQTIDIFCHPHLLTLKYSSREKVASLLMVLMDGDVWNSFANEIIIGDKLPQSFFHYRKINTEITNTKRSTFEKIIYLPVSIDPIKHIRCLMLSKDSIILWKGSIDCSKYCCSSLTSKSFFSRNVNPLDKNALDILPIELPKKKDKIETILEDPFWKLFDENSSRKIVESMFWVDIPPNSYILGLDHFFYSYKVWKPPLGQKSKGVFFIFGCYTFAYSLLARELSSNHGYVVVVSDLFVSLQTIQDHKCPFRPKKDILFVMRSLIDLFRERKKPAFAIADNLRSSFVMHYLDWDNRIEIDGAIFLSPIFGAFGNSKLRSKDSLFFLIDRYVEKIYYFKLFFTFLSNGFLFGNSLVIKGKMPKIFFEYSETTNSHHNGNFITALIIPFVHRLFKKVKIPILYCHIDDCYKSDKEEERIGNFVKKHCFSNPKSKFIYLSNTDLLSLMTHSSKLVMDWVDGLGISYGDDGGYGDDTSLYSPTITCIIQRMPDSNLAKSIILGFEDGNLLNVKGTKPEHIFLPQNLIRKASLRSFNRLFQKSKKYIFMPKKSLIASFDLNLSCGVDFIHSPSGRPKATILFLASKISVPFLIKFANIHNFHIIRQDPFLRTGKDRQHPSSATLKSPLSFLSVVECNLVTLRTNYPSAPLFLGGIDIGANLSLLYGCLLSILETFQPADGIFDRKNFFQTVYQKVHGLILICNSQKEDYKEKYSNLSKEESEELINLGILVNDIENPFSDIFKDTPNMFELFLPQCEIPKFIVSSFISSEGLISNTNLNEKLNEKIKKKLKKKLNEKVNEKVNKSTTSIYLNDDPQMEKMAEWILGICDLMSKSTYQYKKLRIQDFVPLELIGIGGFGRVYLVKHSATGHYMALKVMDKIKIEESSLEDQVENERSLLLECKGLPFIVSYQGSFQTNSNIYIGMEFIIGGELGKLLKTPNKGIPLDWIKFYMSELIIAIEGLHSLSIFHRDIKLENILLDALGHISLVDFGFSKKVPLKRSSSFCGSPFYIAPEIIKLNRVRNSLYECNDPLLLNDYGMEVDLWSMGIVMYYLLEGRAPFVGRNCRETYRSIINDEPHFSIIENIDSSSNRNNSNRNSSSSGGGGSGSDNSTTNKKEAILLIKALLQKEAKLRPTIEDIKNHAFFTGINWIECSKYHLIPPFQPKYVADGDISNYPRLDWESFMDFKIDPPKREEYIGFEKSV